MIKAGIIGGAGYTAGELIRILLYHPEVELTSILSNSHAGEYVHVVHKNLLGETDLQFTKAFLGEELDVVFLCSGHGKSRAFLESNSLSPKTKIIDLGRDFRLEAEADWKGEKFVYGLPEAHKPAIQQAKYIANPGCFATAIQLALLPLAASAKLINAAHINAMTGSTGAGQAATATTHFTWRNNNISFYKPFTHQHLDEIQETLQENQGNSVELNFIPMRGNFARGIFATAYTESDLSKEEALQLYQEYYKEAAMTFVTDRPLSLKEVVNTSKCLISIEKHGKQLLVTSIIDNLLKGASGQAVQNMNLLFGLEENMGLQLKGSTF